MPAGTRPEFSQQAFKLSFGWSTDSKIHEIWFRGESEGPNRDETKGSRGPTYSVHGTHRNLQVLMERQINRNSNIYRALYLNRELSNWIKELSNSIKELLNSITELFNSIRERFNSIRELFNSIKELAIYMYV